MTGKKHENIWKPTKIIKHHRSQNGFLKTLKSPTNKTCKGEEWHQPHWFTKKHLGSCWGNGDACDLSQHGTLAFTNPRLVQYSILLSHPKRKTWKSSHGSFSFFFQIVLFLSLQVIWINSYTICTTLWFNFATIQVELNYGTHGI